MNVVKTTGIFIFTAALLGIGTYGVKQRVMVLEDNLTKTNRKAVALQESSHLLQAELSYLTAPKRLQYLASKHLNFVPVTGYQMVSLETLNSLISEQHRLINMSGLKAEQ